MKEAVPSASAVTSVTGKQGVFSDNPLEMLQTKHQSGNPIRLITDRGNPLARKPGTSSAIEKPVTQLVLEDLDKKFLRDHILKFSKDYDVQTEEEFEGVTALISAAFDDWMDIEADRGDIIAAALDDVRNGRDVLTWKPQKMDMEEELNGKSGIVASGIASSSRHNEPPQEERKEEDDNFLPDDDFELPPPPLAEMAGLIFKWGGNRLMNKESRARAETAMVTIRNKVREPDLFSIHEVVTAILSEQNLYIYLKSPEASGTYDRKQKTDQAAQAIQAKVSILEGFTVPLEQRVRPDGIYYPEDAAPLVKEGKNGQEFRVGHRFFAVTGSKGASNGKEASTSPASDYLNKTYGRNVKFVAGHLVTRRAGGPAADFNLTPFTNEFNQTDMRIPESKAELLLRQDKVIRYESEVTEWAPFSLFIAVPDLKDRQLVASKVIIRITVMSVRPGGNPADIRDWSVPVAAFNYPS